MASMLTCHSVSTSSTTTSITSSKRAHPIRTSPIGPHSSPVSNVGSSHGFRSRTPQRMRLFSTCRASTPLQEITNNSDINASRQRSSPTETSSLLAPAVVLSPLFLSLVQPLAAASAMQSIAVDQGSATATVLASSLTVAAAVGADQAGAHFLYELADMDAKTAGTLALILRPVLSITTLLMIVRIVLTWYPQVRQKRHRVQREAPFLMSISCSVIQL